MRKAVFAARIAATQNVMDKGDLFDHMIKFHNPKTGTLFWDGEPESK